MLIGLNGRKQAGKDTVYDRLAHLLADVVEVERRKFAALLYTSAAEALGVTPEFLDTFKTEPSARVITYLPTHEGEVTERANLTVREYLQRYGTEAHRDVFGDSFWVDALDLEHEGRLVVVTDTRFPNEARAVRAAGGAVVEVIGPMGRATDDAHPSEAPLPAELIDATLINTVRDDGFRSLDVQLAALFRQSWSVGVPS